jgi:hypothetical protein
MANDYQVDDNPYDPAIQDQQPQTLPPDEVIRLAMRTYMLQHFNVWRPAQVMSVLGNNRVNLQIQLKSLYIDEDVPFTIPQLQNVMVRMPHGKNYQNREPIAVGDTGIALFCDRSLDIWSNGDGSPVDPNDSRSHDLNDAVFITGLDPFANAIDDDTDDYFLGNGNGTAQLRFTQDGKILIGGTDSASPAVLGDVLVTAMDALIGQISAIITALGTVPLVAVTGSPGGASPINPAITALLSTASGQLSSIKSQYFDTPSTNIVSQQTFIQRLIPAEEED